MIRVVIHEASISMPPGMPRDRRRRKINLLMLCICLIVTTGADASDALHIGAKIVFKQPMVYLTNFKPGHCRGEQCNYPLQLWRKELASELPKEVFNSSSPITMSIDGDMVFTIRRIFETQPKGIANLFVGNVKFFVLEDENGALSTIVASELKENVIKRKKYTQ